MLLYLAMIETPGDQDKFQTLYTAYRDIMFYVAKKILHNDQDAEDAVHNAFVKIIERIETISDLNSPQTKAFIVTIVENKAIDLYRQKARHPAQELCEEIQGVEAAYDGEDGLARCILALPARDRDWILLKYDQGYSAQELSKLLGALSGCGL